MCWPPHELFGTFTFFDWLCREAILSTSVDKGKVMTKKKTVLAVILSEFALITGGGSQLKLKRCFVRVFLFNADEGRA